MEKRVKSVEMLKNVAEELLNYAQKRKIFLLTGDLGAGKTTFIKQFAEALGCIDEVSSPTYSIVNEYELGLKPAFQGKLYHLDLYRLKSLEEALDIGIEQYLDSGDYCFIEWPAIIRPLLANDVVEIKMEIIENSTRKILFL